MERNEKEMQYGYYIYVDGTYQNERRNNKEHVIVIITTNIGIVHLHNTIIEDVNL